MNGKNRTDKIKRHVSRLLLTLLLAAMSVQTVFAATSAITSVSITLSIDLTAGESLPDLETGYTDNKDCEVMVSSNSKYDLRSAKWSTSVDEVKLGSTYTMKIYLMPLNDYRFRGSYSSSNVKVKGGTVLSAKVQSNGDLLVTVKSKQAKGEFEAPEDVYWSDTANRTKFGQARWSRVEDAAYDAYLYRGSTIVHKATKITGNSFNFYPYMTRKGTYTFRVRAVPGNSTVESYAKSSGWTISDEVFIDEQDVSDGKGQSVNVENNNDQPANNYQVGWIKEGNLWYFRYPDGTYVKDGWTKADGKWYLFDGNGVMLTGWQARNDQTYYLNSSGEMVTGWIEYQNRWYYMNPTSAYGVEGALHKGWLDLSGKIYYMDETGAMAEGWCEVDGFWYYFYPGSGEKAVNTMIGPFAVDQSGIWHKPESEER